MTIAIWCILAAGLLPYLATLIAKSRPGFDNANPRGWLQKQEGFRQRANYAQLNSFEAFPLFAVAVLVGTYLQVARHSLDELAIGFVIARVLYIVCYVANLAALRSVVWFIGMCCCIAIFIAAART